MRFINPNKASTIKAKKEKLLRVGFIYLVSLNEWVSNPILVNKKQSTIHICNNFCDFKKVCPKGNYPTSFIDQVIENCTRGGTFSFINGFSCYNQIEIKPEDQHKTTFIFPWGTFAYRKIPFGLKNVGSIFQWAMYYVFHDIKKIVQDYLYDLSAHSKNRDKHLAYMKSIFDRCQKYKIRLNPHKCIFCNVSGRLLGFIISNYRIMVDPPKVKAIIQLHPPFTICQLQSLQGNVNFLRRCITNYTITT